MRQRVTDSIVDLNELKDRIGDDHKYLNDLINTYVYDLEAKLGRAKMLLIEESLDDLLTLVQSLKGSTSYMNMHYIWQAVCLLENALKRKDLKMINIYFDVLSKEHQRLVEYIDILNN